MSPNGQNPAPRARFGSLPRPLYGRIESLPNQALAYRHSHPWAQLSYASQGVLEVRTAAGR
ncbi:MAG TPA: AraC family transcriptional regulator, partial [Pseudomonas sp.]|nr:AraC family transcriptional regulator [Pseudomonas sp.]